MKWLFSNPALKLRDKIFNILAAFGINLLWIIFIQFLLNYMYGYNVFQIGPFFPPPPSSLFIFFSACIFAPFFEEALFRYAPISIVRSYGEKKILPMIVITSAIFGWVHGHGMYSILVQGVGGFILSCLYIKNNYSYLSSVAAHFLWNLSVIYLLHF